MPPIRLRKAGILALLALAACTSQPFVLEVPLRIVASDPSGGASNVTRDALLRVSFSEALNRPPAAALQLFEVTSAGDVAHAATLAYSGAGAGPFVVSAKPTPQLEWGREYRLVVNPSVTRERDGAPLPTAVSWTFRTELPPALALVAAAPSPGAAGVARTTRPALRFSEPVRCPTLSGTVVTETFDPATVKDGAAATREIPGTWACTTIEASSACRPGDADPCVVRFVPSNIGPIDPVWRFGSSVTLALPAGVKSTRATADAGGLDAPAITFEIEDPPPFAITAVGPTPGAKGVERDAAIVFAFSEPPDCASLGAGLSVTERKDGDTSEGTAVSGKLTCQGPASALDAACTGGRCTATFTPAAPFAWSSRVTLQLRGRDTATASAPFVRSARATSRGGILEGTFIATFDVVDPPPFAIAQTRPASGATQVASDTGFRLDAPAATSGFACESLERATVTELLDPESLDNQAESVIVEGTWSCTDGATSATWAATPGFRFQASSRVSVALPGGARGAAIESASATSRGGQLPAPGISVEFFIEDPPSLGVLATSPSDLATGLPADTSFEATFTAPLDCAGVKSGTNVLVEQRSPALASGSAEGPFLPAPGTVTCDASAPNRLRFTATNAFVPSTRVRVTLGHTDPAKTLAAADRTSRGGRLAAPVVAAFRIADPPVLRVVSITATGQLANDLSTDASLRVTFDRPASCASIWDVLVQGRRRVTLTDQASGQAIPIAAATCGNGLGIVGQTGSVLTIVPAAGALAAGRDVVLTLLAGIHAADATDVGTSTYGRLPQNVLSVFRVGEEALQLVRTLPSDGDQQAAPGTDLALTFNQPLDESTVIPCTNATTPAGCNMLLGDGDDPTRNPVPLQKVGFSAPTRTLTLRPASPLRAGKAYALRVRDESGRPSGLSAQSRLTAAVVVDFRVADSDLVRSTSPANGARDVSIAEKPCVTFTDTVDATTLAGRLGATLTDRFGRTVSIALHSTQPFLRSDADGRTNSRVCLNVVAQRLDALPGERAMLYLKDIQVTAAAGVKVGGATLANPYGFSFRTREPPGLVGVIARNAVVSVALAPGVRDVPLRPEFLVELARSIDVRTAGTVSLARGTFPIPFDIAELAGPNTLRLATAQALVPDADHVLTIAGGAQGLADTSGNPLEATVAIPFRTATQTTARVGPPETTFPADATLPIVFSRNVFLPSATTANIRASTAGGDTVPGVIAQSASAARSVLFLPQAPWRVGSGLTLEVTAGVLDELGNPVVAARGGPWSVLTGSGQPPSALSAANVSPAPGAVAADQAFTLSLPGGGTNTLANRFLPIAFSNETVVLAASPTAPAGCPVAGTIPLSFRFEPGTASSLPDRVIFTPAAPTGANRLRAGCAYQLSVLARALPNLFLLSAQEGPAQVLLDYTGESAPPTLAAEDVRVRRVGGLEGALGPVSLVDALATTSVSATFSEPVDPATVSAQTFVLSRGGAVAGAYAVIGRVVTFTPSAPLAAGGAYTLTLRTSASGLFGLSDLAGNTLRQDASFTFTVESAIPTFDRADRGTDGTVRLTFSEPMDASSLVPSSVGAPGSVRVVRTTGAGSPAEVYGLLSIDAASPRVVVFTPAEAMPGGVGYEVRATTDVRDASRTPLAAAQVRSL